MSTTETIVRIPVDVETRGKILERKRLELGLSLADVSRKLTAALNLDKPFYYKRLSDLETGRVKKLDEPLKSALYEILQINEQRDLMIENKVISRDVPHSVQLDVIYEFHQFAENYVLNHRDILSSDSVYTRAVKCDVRDMLEEFLRIKDQQENK